MKQFVLLFLFIFTVATANAQDYMTHLREKGKGVVVVNESKDIDDLVNGKTQATKTTTKTTDNITAKTEDTPNHVAKKDTIHHEQNDSARQARIDSLKREQEKQEQERQALEEKRREAERANKTEENNEMEIPTVDLRKKVMRGAKKVTGYRVQAYSGTNSRESRLKAEQIRNTIKMKFPNEPVYVHFYSPRWICRVGNYRSLGEAQRMLSNLRKLGYNQACIVKGKITVQ